MRILHVASHSGVYRGGAVQLCRMATWQVAQGHVVRVIANSSERHPGKTLAQELESWRLALPEGVAVSHLPLSFILGFLPLRISIFRFKPDIVHLHRDQAVESWRRFAKRRGPCPAVAQRGTTRAPKTKIRSTFRSKGIQFVTCVSDAVKESVAAKKVPPSKLITIYGSVDTERFSPAPRNESLRSELGFAPQDYVIGSLSSYRKAKGLRFLLECFVEASRQNPHLRLLMLGTGVKEKLERRAVEYGVADKVVFAGHATDVVPYFHAMDCSVVTARSREGLSGVLRESLSCGIPVISTNSDGNPEIVKHGETGLLVNVDDAGALKGAMLEAAAKPEEMKAMAARGRGWVLENCTLQHQGERLIEVYRRAIEAYRS